MKTKQSQTTQLELEELVHSVIQAYQEGWNQMNSDKEIKYNLTLTYHKVPAPKESKSVNVDIAYLRLTRLLRDKGQENWNESLIDQHVHQFKNTKERLDPKAPWKEELYLLLLSKLCYAGLEYAEMLRRLQSMQATEKSKIIAPEKSEIIVTDKIPDEMSADELKYKEWVDKNNKHATG